MLAMIAAASHGGQFPFPALLCDHAPLNTVATNANGRNQRWMDGPINHVDHTTQPNSGWWCKAATATLRIP